MKTLKIVLMVALAIVVASVFTGAVSAADQTDSQLIVKDENADFGAVHQTTGQNESGNTSKVDLNGAAKPEETVNVENSTISGPNKDITGIAPVQSAGNSTEIGKEADSSDLQSGNSRELTNKGKMMVKAQGIGEEIGKWGRYAWDQISAAGRYITDNWEKYTKRVSGGVDANGNKSSWHVNANVTIYG